MSKLFQKIAELEGAKIDLVFISIHVCLCPHFACLFYHCPDRQIQATMQREEHRTSANFEKTVLKFIIIDELFRIFVDCFVISLITKVVARRTCFLR